MAGRIAVAGATGYIGGRLVPRLLDAGYRVRCLARSPEKLKDRAWAGRDGLEIVGADLEDAAALERGLEGCEAAYYLVHSINWDGPELAEYDRRLAERFAGTARQAGVGRIVYLGGLGETGPGLSGQLSLRLEVQRALDSGGVPVTVLRAAMIIGSGSASFEILRYLVERLPVIVTPKWVSAPYQPIALENVIEYLVRVLAVPETAGNAYDIGGSDVMPYREVMRVMAEELRLRRRVMIPLPVLAPGLSSYLIQLVTPLNRRIVRPRVEGLKGPVVCREERIRELVPQRLLSVREAIHAAQRQLAAHEVETTWSMAGAMPGDPDWAGGAVFRDERAITIHAPAWAAYRAVCRVGGGHGWYAAYWLWRIRGWMDLLVGGPGLRRGRRDPEEVGYGEALDFWRVTGIERNRRLALRAEMKLPGEALLEFRIEPVGEGQCRLRQRALFLPRGLAGLLYWYSVAPFHHVVFRGMLAGIRREARRIAARK